MTFFNKRLRCYSGRQDHVRADSFKRGQIDSLDSGDAEISYDRRDEEQLYKLHVTCCHIIGATIQQQCKAM